MRHTIFCTAFLVLMGAALGVADRAAQAQAFPERPITLVIPFPPGGATDASGRVLAQFLPERLGQNVIVDNRAGAGGNIAAEFVARAKPDGHTLLYGQNGILAINPTLYSKVPFDPQQSFAPIGPTQAIPFILVVSTESVFRSARELVAALLQSPGKHNFASGGNGTTSHLAGEMFMHAGKLSVVHVPYRGGAQAIVDVIANRVTLMIEASPNALPHVKAGRLRALAVTTSARLPDLPDVPTMEEVGLPEVLVTAWAGVLAPAGTSQEVVSRLSAALRDVNRDLRYQQRVAQFGAQVIDSSPAEFREFIRKEGVRWGEVVRRSGAKVD